jgi:long-chain acyl-CoA synthetase
VVDAMSAADPLQELPKRIHQVIVRHLDERPNHPVFVENSTTWSYRQFADAVDAVKADFVRLGIRAGDRVLAASENCVPLAEDGITDLLGVPATYQRLLATECSPGLTGVRPEAPRQDESVGKFLPGIEHHLADSKGAPVPNGEVGELHVRDPNVMLGYYRAPELTTRAIDRGGWFNTGDLGRLDGDHLFIAGRSKELIIRSGFKVYPAEAEAVLNSHEMVVQSAVDRPWVPGNEEVVAFVQLQPGAALTSEELMEYAGRHLTSYKRPCEIVLLESLPAASTGKVLKHKSWEAARAAADAPPAPLRAPACATPDCIAESE